MATKDELQDELESRGLDTTGTKAELEDRLAADDAEREGSREGGSLGLASSPPDKPVKLGVRDKKFHYTFVVDHFPTPGSDQDAANRAETERQAVNFGWIASGPAAESHRDEVSGGGGDITYSCPVVENTRSGREGLDYEAGTGPYS